MGHLVNAKGFRIGNGKSWNIKGIDNNDYFRLNSISNFLSYYLENFFNIKRFKNNGFIYSHFILRGFQNNFKLEIYLFGGYFDALNLLLIKKNKVKKINIVRELYLKKYIRYCQNFVFNILEKRLLIDLKFLNIISIKFFPYSETNLSSEILGRLVAVKLEALYSINQVVNPIIKDFNNKKIGLSINCSGRFTRKQRAHFMRFRAGSVPFSTIMRPIEYFFIPVRLKYGACGIKIWISK